MYPDVSPVDILATLLADYYLVTFGEIPDELGLLIHCLIHLLIMRHYQLVPHPEIGPHSVVTYHHIRQTEEEA